MNSAPRASQGGESGHVSWWGEVGPCAFCPESLRGVDGAPAPAAAPRTDRTVIPAGTCSAAPGGSRPDREQTLQEDLREDGQDPETSVSAVILSTNQLANIPVEDG